MDVANEWEFKVNNFMPFAPLTLDRLMVLVQEVELPETKMALLNTISVVVERLEHHVSLVQYAKEEPLTILRSRLTPTGLSPCSHHCGSSLVTNIS